MRRPVILALAAASLSLGAWAIACSTSYQSTTATDAGGEAGSPGEGGGINDGAAAPSDAADAGSSDGGAFTCADFDGSTFDAGDLTNATCSGQPGKNLLNDPQNCGRCGHGCGGAACDGMGHCSAITVATIDAGGSPVQGLALSGGYAYLTTGSVVWRASLATPVTAAEVVSPGAAGYGAIAVDDQLYLSGYFGVFAEPLATGQASEPSMIMSAAQGRFALAPGLVFATSASANAVTIALRDGGPSGIGPFASSSYAYDVAVTASGSYAVWIDRTAVTPDGGDGGAVGALVRLARGESSPTRIATLVAAIALGGYRNENVLAVDEQYAYYGDPFNGDLTRYSLTDTPSVATVISPGHGRTVRAPTVDGDDIYFMTASDSPNYYNWELRRVSVCGGPETVVLPATQPLTASEYLAVDSTSIYLGVPGALIRVVK